jgi:hypothetical protein
MAANWNLNSSEKFHPFPRNQFEERRQKGSFHLGQWRNYPQQFIPHSCTLRMGGWGAIPGPCILRAGIFKKSMGARHWGGIGLSYRPARLHRLAEFIPFWSIPGPHKHLKIRALCVISECALGHSLSPETHPVETENSVQFRLLNTWTIEAVNLSSTPGHAEHFAR